MLNYYCMCFLAPSTNYCHFKTSFVVPIMHSFQELLWDHMQHRQLCLQNYNPQVFILALPVNLCVTSGHVLFLSLQIRTVTLNLPTLQCVVDREDREGNVSPVLRFASQYPMECFQVYLCTTFELTKLQSALKEKGITWIMSFLCHKRRRGYGMNSCSQLGSLPSSTPSEGSWAPFQVGYLGTGSLVLLVSKRSEG